MKSIIMAGGSGTRLWPLSRKNFPKQFLSLMGSKSLIQLSAERLSRFTDVDDIFVVAGEGHQLAIQEQLSRLFQKPYSNLVLEPTGRNTAPAVALTVKYMLDKANSNEDEILFFSPSDHIIRPDSLFANNVKDCFELGKESIVTFGIVPSRPETGYGYIELGEEAHSGAHSVKSFVEKPDKLIAEKYLASGNYLWNSGMFLFSVKVILEAFRKFSPELYQMITEWTYDEAIKNYNKIQSISIDNAVMEKAENIICKKIAVDWNDVGSWDAVYDISPKDESNNAVMGDVELLNVQDSLVISSKKLTTLIGLKNIVVVETDDAILISDRSQTQYVKEMVSILKEKNRPELNEHTTNYRPWGSYTILNESGHYKIKKIIVKVGQKLSLQRHIHRSEHWIVVSGTALVQVGDAEIFVHENESTYIPKSMAHRLANPGKIPLELIEVQSGEYVGEDDIERIEDVYGRVTLHPPGPLLQAWRGGPGRLSLN
jgi:mannose-1-phosphate guanylyltransferase/mannose-6-phosphate isomerase